MSIVRIGLGETKNFAEGYEAIFGKKEPMEESTTAKKPAIEAAKKAKPAKKPAAKKPAKTAKKPEKKKKKK
jgi:hypothetical protein